MHFDLNFIWFVLVGILFTGYAILDGFDLGVGALHLFTKKDEERRTMLNAIGPVWDGNEVWLVTGGGALLRAQASKCLCHDFLRLLSAVGVVAGGAHFSRCGHRISQQAAHALVAADNGT